jgi:hypothetical protein
VSLCGLSRGLFTHYLAQVCRCDQASPALGLPYLGSTQKSRDFNGKPDSMIATQ